MSGTIVDLPVRVCPSCTAIFVQDDQMYEDTSVCPRCGSDMASTAREGGGGTVRTILSRAHVLGTKEGIALVTDDGFALRITPTSRWG